MDMFLEIVGSSGLANLTPGNLVMFLIAGTLIYLAVTRGYEPLLLIPIGFGALLANLPLANLSSYADGILGLLYAAGIKTQLLPPLIFLGVGVLTDFRPLLGRPITFLLGAAAQLGIFAAALGAAYLLDFTPQEAAAIGIIGGADGPTSIFLTVQLAPHLLGAVAVAAYSYMSLVPIIQPPIMRLLTTRSERAIDMPQARPVSRRAVIIFPIATALLASLFVPDAAPLLGLLMFGNLLRESGVTERLKKTAGGPMIDIVTILLGLTVGATMTAATFLTWDTIKILVLGAVAVAAYSYMSLVPIIQPPIMRLLTTRSERAIDMPQARPVSKRAVIIFPIVTALLASLFVPDAAPLLGLLMFGNLLRESGVTERLKKTAGGPMIDIVTILLGLTVGATMTASTFLTWDTIKILVLGAVAFAVSTAGGILLAKLLNVFLRDGRKINPCIGAAGVSAVPMAARVVQNFVAKETGGRVNPLMPAMGPNVAGVIGSAVAAGIFLMLLK